MPAATTGRAVFIGASAGGVEALAELIAALPHDFPAPVLVVLHVSPRGTSVLPEILTRAGALTARNPGDGERLGPGIVYVAPGGVHLIVEDDRARLGDGPAEHGVRPAVDTLFRSAARVYGPGAVGVVLSGMLDDGTAGLLEIKHHGGVAIAQDPGSAAFPEMPRSAIENVAVDYVLTPTEIGAMIDAIVRRAPPTAPTPTPARARAPGPVPAPAGETPAHPAAGTEVKEGWQPPGMRTEVTCPTCRGVLWEEVEGGLTMYRCATRHAFTADTLLAMQGQALESAVSQPVRALRERGMLLERLAKRARQRTRGDTATRFHEQAAQAFTEADTLERAARLAQHRAAGKPEHDEPA